MSRPVQQMSQDQIRAHFPRASRSLLEANGSVTLPVFEDEEPAPAVVIPKPRINKTEAEFGRILEAQKSRGDILEYRYEGIKLAWGADPTSGKPMIYTPDYFIVRPDNGITVVEVKGGFIYPQDMIRFKGCRAEWPLFQFEMHQKKAGEWSRIL